MKKRRKLLSLILGLAILLTLAQPVLALGVSEGNSTSTYEEYVEENGITEVLFLYNVSNFLSDTNVENVF